MTRSDGAPNTSGSPDGPLNPYRASVFSTLTCPRCEVKLTDYPSEIELSEKVPTAEEAKRAMSEYVTGIEDIIKNLVRQHMNAVHLRNPYWLSWFHEPQLNGDFELDWPWWLTGTAGHAQTIVAAVKEEYLHLAQSLITNAYDRPLTVPVRWRFAEPCKPGFNPFNDRFRREPWMRWDDEPSWQDARIE